MHDADVIKRKFSILQEITSAIVLKDNIRDIADLILDLAMTYAHAEKGSLMLLSDRNEIVIFASRGLEPQFIGSYKVSVGDGIAGSVAQDRLPVLVEDIEKNEAFQKLRRNHYKTKSFISCPIISKNELLGVLNINDKKDGSPFNGDEFELTKILANHAAIALENAFLMSQLKSKAKELEDVNKKLVDTDILKTEFLTRISHELRTPLNSLKGAIYFLQHARRAGIRPVAARVGVRRRRRGLSARDSPQPERELARTSYGLFLLTVRADRVSALHAEAACAVDPLSEMTLSTTGCSTCWLGNACGPSNRRRRHSSAIQTRSSPATCGGGSSGLTSDGAMP